MPTRSASARWEGGLKGGRGSYKGANGLAGQYNFSSRFEEGPGSNPEELLAAAEVNGIRRFRAWVLADNRRMLDLIARLGEVRERAIDQGVVELAFTARPASSSGS